MDRLNSIRREYKELKRVNDWLPVDLTVNEFKALKEAVDINGAVNVFCDKLPVKLSMRLIEERYPFVIGECLGDDDSDKWFHIARSRYPEYLEAEYGITVEDEDVWMSESLSKVREYCKEIGILEDYVGSSICPKCNSKLNDSGTCTNVFCDYKSK